MQLTYRELFPDHPTQHLAETVERYFCRQTPLWWVDTREGATIGCLWLGAAVDQTSGENHTHIFLLYVAPNHRRQGIGSCLMQQAEAWAKAKGDRQIGLQVFQSNVPALALYQSFGYQTQSLWMVKRLEG